MTCLQVIPGADHPQSPPRWEGRGFRGMWHHQPSSHADGARPVGRPASSDMACCLFSPSSKHYPLYSLNVASMWLKLGRLYMGLENRAAGEKALRKVRLRPEARLLGPRPASSASFIPRRLLTPLWPWQWAVWVRQIGVE